MSDYQLQGKVAIVTGASSGIGRATALALAREGTHLVLAARNREAIEQVREQAQALGVKALAVPTDVADREQVRRLAEEALRHLERIDVLVACAGVYYPRKLVRELSVEDVESMMAVNFYGCVYGIFGVLPHMLARNQGHIVVVSSVDGKKALPLDGAYAASKFAVAGFAEALRQELHGSGVHVSTVFPGRVDTPLIANIRVPFISAKIPPEQVARAIVKAIVKRRAEVLVPYFGAKLLVVLNSLSAGLGDWGVRFFHLEGWEADRELGAGG